jgi:type IV pilus assembly protein PilN
VIHINLLPHREIRRAARLRQFLILTGLSLGLAACVVAAGYVLNERRIEDQNDRNRLLKTEIAKLDKQIEEIRLLKEQTAALLARKQVVETLQANRAEVVHLLDQMVRLLPDGVYLKSVKQVGKRVNVTGIAQSSARVSTLMRNIDASPWVGMPELVEIKGASVNGLRLNEFTLNFQIRPPAQTGAPATGATATAPGTPAPATAPEKKS